MVDVGLMVDVHEYQLDLQGGLNFSGLPILAGPGMPAPN